MRGKIASIISMASALAILAASCTDEVPRPPVDRRLSAARVCRVDPFGCVRVDRGKPIRLVALTPLHSESAIGRHGATLAMQMAVERRRPLIGRDVVLTRRDDACVGEYGLKPVDRLTSDPTIAAVIGAECSTVTAFSADILADEGVVFVSSMSDNPGLTRPARHAPYFLRTAHNARIQGTAMAAFARERLALSRAAAVHERKSSARSLVAQFMAEFVRRGGRAVYRQAYRGGKTHPGRLMARIQRAAPDFLYAPVDFWDTARLVEQRSVTAGRKETLLGGAEGIFHPDWLEVVGSAAEGVYVSAPDSRPQNARFDREFVPQFQQRFGTFENTWPGFLARAYDATNMILDAIEDVAFEEDGTLYISRTALRDRMFATKDYPGLSGTLTCDSNGDCNHSTPVTIYQVKNGAFRKTWTWDPAA